MSLRLLAGTLFVALGLSSQPLFADQSPLEVYTWEKRLLLVFTPSADDPRLRAQQKILTDNRPGLIDRDLVTLQLSPGSHPVIDNTLSGDIDSNLIYREFYIASPTFAVLLIGKDGTVKFSSRSPVASNKLFDLIDSMPMRQWEMQNKEIHEYQD